MRIHAPLAVCFAFFTAITTLQAAIWPEQWWEYKRKSVAAVQVSDKPVWDEYGLDEAATAQYDDGKVKFKATGYRLKDTTAAMAAFQWLRPGGWRNSDVTDLAATNGANTLLTQGNYLILLEGFLPDKDKLDILWVQLPRMERSALPPLTGYLPPDGFIDGSARYVTGPASLAKFESRIPASLAAFHLGAEAQLGRYRLTGATASDTSLAIFNYPTPAIARDVASKFEQAGVVAKRTGPMVAAVFTGDPDAAERLLAKINYKASVSWNEPANTPKQNPGEMLANIFKLIGVLFGGIAMFGLLIGLTKLVGRRYLGWGPAGGNMVQLGLDSDRQR